MSRNARLDDPTIERLPFRKTGGWIERPADLQPALEGPVSADVIVVGGGFAGLSTALELNARGAKVVLLEQEFCGFGASGRNAGYTLGSLGIEFDLFAKRVGHDKARQVVSFYDQAVPYVQRRLTELEIDCDYRRSAVIRAAVDPSQKKRLLHDRNLGLQQGSQTRLVDEAEMRARGIPPAFLFGYEQSGGTLNPGKYVAGLRRAALRAGVIIYEGTPLLSYSDGRIVTCTTPRGTASAPVMVLATNAYTPQIGLLRDKIVPIRVSAVETQPLTDQQLASLGWHGREGIMTPHLVMEAHRLTAHNTIVSTVRQLNYAYGSRTPNRPDEGAYRAIIQGQQQRFPTLRGIGIRHCWSGYVSAAYDAMPVFGATGADQNIHHVAGCSGHGLCTHSYVGALLADKIDTGENALLSALDHKTPRTMPEPVQWAGLKTVFAATRLYDSWTNSRARKARGTSAGRSVRAEA